MWSSGVRLRNGLLDVHHHPTDPSFAALLRRSDRTISGRVGEVDHEWFAQQAIALMDSAHIACSILSHPPSAPSAGADRGSIAHDEVAFATSANEQLAELCDRSPDRFVGFATLPWRSPSSCVGALEALRREPFVGVVMPTNIDGAYPGDVRFVEVLEALHDADATVFLHPTDMCGERIMRPAAPRYLLDLPFDTTRAVLDLVLSGAFERFDRIKFILAHAGGTVPFLASRLATADHTVPGAREAAPGGVRHALTKFWYETALSTDASMLGCIRSLVDDRRVLFGSDFPATPARAVGAAVAAFRDAGLTSSLSTMPWSVSASPRRDEAAAER